MVNPHPDLFGRIAERDADERVARIHDPREARQVWLRAKRNRDVGLMKSIEARVEREGWSLTGGSAMIRDLAAKTHAETARIVSRHKASSQELARDVAAGRVSREFAREKIGPGFVSELAELNASVSATAARARSAYEQAVRAAHGYVGDVQEQLLTEMRRSKVWERIMREFRPEKDDPAHYLTGRMANPDERAAILDEGPSWLASHGFHNSAESILTGRLRELDPNVDEAARVMQEAEGLETVTRINTQRLTARLTDVPPTFENEPDGQELTRGYTDPRAVEY